MVVPKDHPDTIDETFETLPNDYASLSYERIAEIYADRNALWLWEELKGMFQTANGGLLRFLLIYQIPLEKFMRYELACRGYDKDHKWVGFKKAEKICLK